MAFSEQKVNITCNSLTSYPYPDYNFYRAFLLVYLDFFVILEKIWNTWKNLAKDEWLSMYIINKCHMESALYGIYALVFLASEISLARFLNVNNSCVNIARAFFPWSILYMNVENMPVTTKTKH